MINPPIPPPEEAGVLRIEGCTFIETAPAGELVGYDNASREIWRAPEVNAAEPAPLDGWSFGIIFAWSIVLAAFLSDFCFRERR